MDNSPTTNFDLIEGHKENIQPIRSGRSARALAASLSPLSANPHAVRSEHAARQCEFEEELKTASELDDPLEVWLRYINWTMETFPSGHSSESGLLPLLERATKEFLHDSQYKNDPRYLKLWVQFAQNFSDAPREVYAYLTRNDIGQRLALFYEEYAALLETLGRKNQAAEIYQSGIENNANPIKRLQRKYDEFLQRMEANPPAADEPSSPALPTVRPALAAKPFGGSAISGGLGGASEPRRQPQPESTKPAKQKMAIFSDADRPAGEKVLPERATGGWENIGSLQHRKKENAHEPKPWTGEILKQQGKAPETDRLMVFRDAGSSSIIQNTPSQNSIISVPGKRPERIAVNLELVYPEEEEEEFCFEELRAKSRGLYGIDWNAQREADKQDQMQRRRAPIEGSRTPIKVKTILSPSPNKGKIRRKGRGAANYTTTSLVDNTVRLESRGQEDEDDDVESVRSDWSDFNLAKSIPKEREDDDEEEEEEEADLDRGAKVATGKMHKLSIFTDEPDQPKGNTAPRKLQIPEPPEDFDPPTLPYHVAKDQSYMQSRLPYMTPIVEKTESFPQTAAKNRTLQASKTPSRVKMPAIDDNDDFMGSSPFRDIPNENRKSPQQPDLLSKKPPPVVQRKEPVVRQGPIIDDKVCNPLDDGMRKVIFQKLQPPLKSYDGYYEYSMTNSGKASDIKKFTRIMAKRDGGGVTGNIPEPPLLEFITGQGGSAYTIRRELGKGAFAPVYLVENHTVGDAEEEAEEDGMDSDELERQVAGRKRWEALKMEHPPNPWEFYVIRQARKRLEGMRAVESIVKAHEMHLFKDEGFLLIEYRDQGTILDLVNHAKSESNTSGSVAVMDELLVMFLAVELLRTTEALHAASLIHGDLKADNCLVRFDPASDHEWSSKYQPDGSSGWSKKGITFIDFGRGIDMKLFHPGVQFIADWKTDQQDCAEMRELRPWTYQVDYHGLAAVIHSMLFGKYIETVAERSGLPGGGPRHYKITTPLKRYWEKDIWSQLFDVLLNPLQHVTKEDNGALPINASLKMCRERMQEHLVTNCDKGIGLKSMIRKLEVSMGAGKRK
ncbi:hypothetical protein K440DRAFT_597071 [Wilcoxina mikolae CBS 423.85]|nr:hypothetical protein K440DRAFT_597071 [Wilcoxina mikolae CBS 423.85]